MAAAVGSRPPRTQDHKQWMCIYPAYLDKTKTVAEGRRVPKQMCVNDPSPRAIAKVCESLNLPHELEVCCNCCCCGCSCMMVVQYSVLCVFVLFVAIPQIGNVGILCFSTHYVTVWFCYILRTYSTFCR
jgi:SRP19 protein